MLKTICYISDSNINNSTNELKELLRVAKINNSKNQITGVLIHKSSNFLQVLEGDQKHVDALFRRISLDDRHQNIFKLLETTIDERYFEGYKFGFTVINTRNALKNLEDYLNWLRDAENLIANEIVAMVKNFITR
ncbi:hypothetical protein GCM10007962_21940 [Yeosuana aromativorans]|uniref:BLUF domain-containing protein n=1 Tax=Yeosuana aromativorans TaxID=288019 RepID=A0A8J3BQ88_9FLAO|nr:BLUF domain-containing protein [Yeosuana aromativorans]GGK27313.1 hypothetical protein GCM10007962_21940 [Yeosuana aromativorans]